jgi:hypothetical protein
MTERKAGITEEIQEEYILVEVLNEKCNIKEQ